MAHKAHVKEAMFATNRKEWEIQIMSVHARKDALVHHRNIVAGILATYCIFDWLLTYDLMETDEVAKMDDRPDEWQAWAAEKFLKTARSASIDARHGPSMGIKYELERSWAGTVCDFLNFYCHVVLVVS